MKKILYTILLSFLILACNAKKDADMKIEAQVKQEINKISLKEKAKKDSINVLLTAEIKKIVIQFDSVHKQVDKEIIFSKYLLKDSYIDTNYHNLWSSKKNREEVVAEMSHAHEHGLVPNDYHLEAIQQYLKNYDTLSLKAHAKLDVLLTDGIILLAYHLIKGKVNPDGLMYSWNFMENKIPKYALALLQNAIKEEQVSKVLHSLEPQDNEYQLLKKQLKLNTEIIKNGGWKKS